MTIDIYQKKLSLYVAGLNIFMCIVVPIAILVELWNKYNEAPENFDSVLIIALGFIACMIPWFLATILLIKGIKQNRPNLMAIWIYLGYLQAFFSFAGIFYLLFVYAKFIDGLPLAILHVLPMIIGFVILIVSIKVVKNLYHRMSIPPPIEPTQVVMVSQVPMEVGPRYMPLFENV